MELATGMFLLSLVAAPVRTPGLVLATIDQSTTLIDTSISGASNTDATISGTVTSHVGTVTLNSNTLSFTPDWTGWYEICISGAFGEVGVTGTSDWFRVNAELDIVQGTSSDSFLYEGVLYVQTRDVSSSGGNFKIASGSALPALCGRMELEAGTATSVSIDFKWTGSGAGMIWGSADELYFVAKLL